jgi:hypothetical protein
MKTGTMLAFAMTVLTIPLSAQETKPVPKNSVRVTVSGCAKGYIFTAGPSIGDLPGSHDVPEGTHLRMNGPRKLLAEITGYTDSMVSITGLMKKDQYKPGGVRIGGGVAITPGTVSSSGGAPVNYNASPAQIDVEGWSPAVGKCLSR